MSQLLWSVYEEENFPHIEIEKCQNLIKTLFFFPRPLQALHTIFFWFYTIFLLKILSLEKAEWKKFWIK